MSILKRSLWFIGVLLLFLTEIIALYAQRDNFNIQIPPPSYPIQFVEDFANLLSDAEKRMLEVKLRRYADSTSTQIGIFTTVSIGNISIEEFNYQLAKSRKLGRKDQNNGIWIIIAQKERKTRIGVGNGIQEIIPYYETQTILEDEMIPFFQKNQFYEGLDKGTETIFTRLLGQFQTNTKSISKMHIFLGLGLGILGIILIVVLATKKDEPNDWLQFETKKHSQSNFRGGGASGSW